MEPCEAPCPSSTIASVLRFIDESSGDSLRAEHTESFRSFGTRSVTFLVRHNNYSGAAVQFGLCYNKMTAGPGSTPANTVYVLVLGGSGAGKSTLVNTLVNFFRAPVKQRRKLPSKSELLVAIPTPYLPANQPEGKHATEAGSSNRMPACCPCLRAIADGSSP